MHILLKTKQRLEEVQVHVFQEIYTAKQEQASFLHSKYLKSPELRY